MERFTRFFFLRERRRSAVFLLPTAILRFRPGGRTARYRAPPPRPNDRAERLRISTSHFWHSPYRMGQR